MELIVRLSNPPGWTRAQGEGENNVDTFAPPDNVQDFADFVSAVVEPLQRAHQVLSALERAEHLPGVGQRAIAPESYVELLKAGAEAARAADPNVVIIAGALASTINLQPDDPPPGNSLNDLLFLQRMYDAGAAPYFDIMAMQGYGLYSGPTDDRMHPRVINISRHKFVRDLMVKNGDAAKPIWIAEMNWNAAPEDVEPRYGRVTLEQQARYLPLAYSACIADWPWIGVANTWYLKRATDLWEKTASPKPISACWRPTSPRSRSMRQCATSRRGWSHDRGGRCRRRGDKERGRQGDWRCGERDESPFSNLQSPISQSPNRFALSCSQPFSASITSPASSLWNDEGNSWAMLARSVGEIAAAAAADIHPPGYYWLLKAWSLLFGDSAVAMRSLSATPGVMLVALTVADRTARWCAGGAAGAGSRPGRAARQPQPLPNLLQPGSAHVHAAGRRGGGAVLGAVVDGGDWRLEIGRLGDDAITQFASAHNLQSPISNLPISFSFLRRRRPLDALQFPHCAGRRRAGLCDLVGGSHITAAPPLTRSPLTRPASPLSGAQRSSSSSPSCPGCRRPSTAY
jgi:hypothetical protein